MTATEEYIRGLSELQAGERSRLRRLAGTPLDETVPGFDVFTGLWWTLRERNQRAPRREVAWLVAKLYGAFAIPHAPATESPPSLATVLGQLELRRDADARRRHRARFDALLRAPLSAVERHLHWALSLVEGAVKKGACKGLDWARLTDDLSIWDRGPAHRKGRDVRDIWAEDYLNIAGLIERRS